MLKLAILGLGEGRSTISAALHSEKVTLHKICDRNEELCRKRVAEFGFPHYTTSYQDLLEDVEIDIIAIYTPDHLHADHVLKALEYGKHVICTKPFIDNLADAHQLLEAAEKSGKKIFVGQSSRFFEPMRKQRKDYRRILLPCRSSLVSGKALEFAAEF